MTKREIATLSFKVLSLYAFLRVIDKLASIIRFLFNRNLTEIDQMDRLNTMILAIPSLAMLFCGILLWYTAPLLASLIFEADVSEDKASASLMDIQTVAFSVVGLFILASSLPFFVRAVVWYTMSGLKVKELAGDIVAFLSQGVLGFWLLFDSRGILRFISSMRRD